MKKYITALIIFFAAALTGLAADRQDVSTSRGALKTDSILSQIENNIFGYEMKNKSDAARIEHLEEYMYGAKKTGALYSRLEALQNDSGFTIQKQTETPEMFNSQQDSIDGKYGGMEKMRGKHFGQGLSKKQFDKTMQTIPNLKEDETVEYTAVDKMEKDLFNKTFKNENIYERLNRLETAVFQKTSAESLNKRVDRLSEVLRPKKTPAYEKYTADDIKMLYNASGMPQIDDNAVPYQLALLENGLLKRSYAGDNNAARLSRLEQKLFTRTFPNDTDIQRVQRLSAAFEAKKSSKSYENNKRMQNMAAITQIGGLLLMILAVLL